MKKIYNFVQELKKTVMAFHLDLDDTLPTDMDVYARQFFEDYDEYIGEKKAGKTGAKGKAKPQGGNVMPDAPTGKTSLSGTGKKNIGKTASSVADASDSIPADANACRDFFFYKVQLPKRLHAPLRMLRVVKTDSVHDLISGLVCEAIDRLVFDSIDELEEFARVLKKSYAKRERLEKTANVSEAGRAGESEADDGGFFLKEGETDARTAGQ